MADLLDQIKGTIVDTYAKRTGETDSTISLMMSKETWMTADEAKRYGFADRITEEQKIAACYNFDLKNFKHPPKELLDGARPMRDMASVKLAAQEKRLAGLRA